MSPRPRAQDPCLLGLRPRAREGLVARTLEPGGPCPLGRRLRAKDPRLLSPRVTTPETTAREAATVRSLGRKTTE